MFIRYHCFYYAIGCLLITLGQYFHSLFYFVLIAYLIWLYFRLSYRHVFICLGLCCLLFIFPHTYYENPSQNIEGTVEKVSDNYCYVKTEEGLIKLYHNHQLQFQDTIKGTVEYLEMNRATNDNAFDEKFYLYGQNVFLKAQLIELKEVKHHYSFYHFLEKRLSTNNDVHSYQRLLLLGEKNEDMQDDYQQLSQYSLVHLFALSGMHIHILYILLFSAISLVIPKRYAKIITYVLIGYYVFSIPMQISLYRAFFTMIVYDLLKDYLNQLDVVSILVVISFFYNPYYIYNISFVFSYFIYFIVILTKEMKYSFIWIYASTIPIVLNINYQFPIFSIFMAILLTPFIEVFYILTCLSVFFSIAEFILQYAVISLQLILQFLDFINLYFQFSKPSILFIVSYYIIYFSILYRISYRKKISSYVAMLISCVLVFSFYSEYKIYGEITMIDVGQGDCTFIRLPFHQGNILIDTGGNYDYDLATTTIIPYLKSIGVHSLDYVYISHSDFDHCGALESLVENFPVKCVIDEYEEYRQIGCMEVRMLEHSYSSDSNDQSLVMLVTINDFQILFTGDISQSVEKELIEKYQDIYVDILKVSHHGSKTASTPELFEWIHPQIAMIGVKKNNIYHHPSDEVIERLERKQITILRTDEDGMFHIRFYPYQKYIIYR